MEAIQQILEAYREGHGAMLVSGRSLYDFVTDDGRIRPLFEALRRSLYKEFGMVFVTYSLANGFHWFENWIASEADRAKVRESLQNSGLFGIAADDREVISTVRAAATLVRTNTENLKWQDGRQMRFAVCFEFTDHFAPCGIPGSQPDSQLVIIELVHIMSQSLSLRNTGNLLLFHGRLDLIDQLVRSAPKSIRLPQPSKEEKQEFIAAALELYDEALFEDGLTVEGVVSLTVNTPNRGLENLLRASHRAARALTAKDIAEQKNRDVEQLSEGTLLPLDTSRARGVRLVGQNIEVPQKFMRQLAVRLYRGDASTPANVLAAGAPATGKTDLVLQLAEQAQCPAYQMVSPKGGIVGETERKARLQQQALREWVPAVAFCDEITEALPLERGEFNGDSGASKAVTAELLASLSDESRRGRSLFIAATNRVWAMGAAMRSRFIVIPVLSPLREDFASIIVATADRITPGCNIRADDNRVLEAGEIFYTKGANPRHIRSALSNAVVITEKETIDPDLILFAARDLCSMCDRASSIYADLQAIRFCTSKSFLPWGNGPADKYSFPEYLKGIVNEANGDVDGSALERRIEELRPYVNV